MDTNDSNKILDEVTQAEYKYGFFTDIETEFAPKGLSEDTIRFISAKKEEPEWMLEFRLEAFRHWQTMEEPYTQFIYGFISRLNYVFYLLADVHN